jgi:hypothetical protein
MFLIFNTVQGLSAKENQIEISTHFNCIKVFCVLSVEYVPSGISDLQTAVLPAVYLIETSTKVDGCNERELP